MSWCNPLHQPPEKGGRRGAQDDYNNEWHFAPRGNDCHAQANGSLVERKRLAGGEGGVENQCCKQRGRDEQQAAGQRLRKFARANDDEAKHFERVCTDREPDDEGPRHIHAEAVSWRGRKPMNIATPDAKIGRPIGTRGASTTLITAPPAAAILPLVVLSCGKSMATYAALKPTSRP